MVTTATLRRRANKARDASPYMDPASRHLHMIADVLARGGKYAQLIEEPTHCGESMLIVLADLWEARAKLAKHPTPGAEAGR
jgi:hypothetical protein